MKNFTLYMFLSFSITFGQQLIPHDKLIRDFDSLAVLLETSHPDPYTPFGGRMAFHKAAVEARNHISENGMTDTDFYFLLSGFVSKLHDGHTYIDFPQKTEIKEEKILPVKFTVAGDGLYIKETQPQYAAYMGYKLQAVNGISMDSLLQKVQFLEPCENIYGAYSSLIKMLSSQNLAQRAMADINDMITCKLVSPSGKHEAVSLEYTKDNTATGWKRFSTAIKEVSNDFVLFAYHFTDESKNIAYFQFNGTYSREVFEFMKAYNMDYRGQLDNIYNKYFPANLKPADDDEAVADIPSLTETFWNMLSEMRKNKSKYLIIDLRLNGGGWTQITFPTLYMMCGDKYFAYDSKIEYNTRISQLWLTKYKITLEAFNRDNNTSYKLGDYRFGYFMARDTSKSASELREEFINSLANSNISGTNMLKQLNGNALYSPKIIVLTSPLTFSAAFHYAYMLKNLCGAIVVGTPSRQAGNTGMETTVFKLNNSSISGSISCAYQLFFPNDNEPGKTIQPDYLLNWNDYKKYDFDSQTETRYILDLMNSGRL